MTDIVRYTIAGSVQPAGWEILERSINLIRCIYKNNVRIYLSYNSLNKDQLIFAHALKALLIDQANFDSPLVSCPSGWKLVPPRIDISSRELFLDNDFLIKDQINQVEQFFNDDSILVLQGKGRYYGRFDSQIASQYEVNAGLFGIPIGYDFNTELHKTLSRVNPGSHYYDEQGLTVATITRHDKVISIPDGVVSIRSHLQDYEPGKKGYHFCGVNAAGTHVSWDQYKTLPLL
jgi:hypothetical protein